MGWLGQSQLVLVVVVVEGLWLVMGYSGHDMMAAAAAVVAVAGRVGVVMGLVVGRVGGEWLGVVVVVLVVDKPQW